jgi:membrane carboxypeptidase/penicillin-binding protein
MRTIDARNAFVMTSLLQSVTHVGTAAPAGRALSRPDIYGKTGTTNDSLDAWFAGWQQGTVAVVWIGYDIPRKLGDRETGGGLALPVWIDYMKTVLKGVPTQEPTARGLPQHERGWYYESTRVVPASAAWGWRTSHLRRRHPTKTSARASSICSAARGQVSVGVDRPNDTDRPEVKRAGI